MRIDLPYGSTTLAADVPGDAVVLRARAAAPLAAPEDAVARTLASPMAGPGLAAIAAGHSRASIAIPDATRPVLGPLVLPPLVRMLRTAGVGEIEVVVATGSHRTATAAEMRALTGGDSSLGLRVRSHDAENGAHVRAGRLKSGVEVWIDAGWIRAPLRLALGVVEPHLLAGFSGGAKTICPGLAALATVRGVHRAALARGQVGPGVVRDNPFRAEIEAAARLAGECFAVEAVAAHAGGLAFASAGPLGDATRAAMEFSASHARIEVRERYDVVVTTAGGAPLDRTLYQAVKGWIAALGIAAPGADVVLVAELRDGIGSPEFVAQLRDPRAGTEVAVGAPRRDAWMVQHVAQARARAKLHAVSSLPAALLAELAIQAHTSVAGAIARIAAARGGAVRVAVLPDGPLAIASTAGSLQTLEGEPVPGGWR